LKQPRTKETILFVDDEESILDVASQFFHNRGYRVMTANNGRTATEILAKEKIDCCFTDINMPEMDGLELAEHIRCRDNTMPVIIMTGYPSLENTIQTLKNGVVDFLIKPISLNQMEIAVQRVLRERELFVKNLLLVKEAESAAKLRQLNSELVYKVEELNILNKIMSDFTTVASSSDVFKRVVDLAVELSHADEARFFIFNDAVKKPVEISVCSASQGEISTARKAPLTCLASGHLAGENREPLPAGVENLMLEMMSDGKPLLVAKNTGTQGLAAEILSFMLVPLTIREKIFGILAVAVKCEGRQFTEKDLYYLSFLANKAAYAIENLALYENIYDNLFATLYAFVKAIEARDPYTEQHSSRVTSIAIQLAKTMGCSEEEQDILNVAARLHDIGKIGIRDDILLKPGRLTQEEFNIIKEHPVIGADIVAQLGLWDREKQIIRCHHERFDGTGYPDGLQKGEIPLLGRILSVADVYDAIASDRAYRKKMEESRILKIMYEGAGSQFDPDVVEAFRQLYDQGTIQKIVGM
jgi:putative nucleotidyltransferase with HDIG domain